MTHGTPSAYNRGCRCLACTEAHRLRCLAMRAMLHDRMLAGDPRVPHGTAGGYKNWGCRCGPCTKANSAASAAYGAGVAAGTLRA